MPKVNKVVKYLVLSDLLLWAGWGFISPIFSIFVVQEIAHATILTAGISVAAYWFFTLAGPGRVAAFLPLFVGIWRLTQASKAQVNAPVRIAFEKKKRKQS